MGVIYNGGAPRRNQQGGGEQQLLQPNSHPPREVSGWSLWKQSAQKPGDGRTEPPSRLHGWSGCSTDSRRYLLAPLVPKQLGEAGGIVPSIHRMGKLR